MSPTPVHVNVVDDMVAGSLASWISCHPLGETTSMLPPDVSDEPTPASVYDNENPPKHAIVHTVVFTTVMRPSAVVD